MKTSYLCLMLHDKEDDKLKIIANRLELLSAAQDAERLVPACSPLEILQCTYLAAENRKIKVAVCNADLVLERNIPVEVCEAGCMVIRAHLLSTMLRQLDGDDVTIECSKKGVATVSSGNATYRIPIMDADNFPRQEIPSPDFTVSVTGIPAMAKRTVFAASNETTSKPQMRCVHMVFSESGTHAVSGDGYRVAYVRGETGYDRLIDILMPASSLKALAGLVSNQDMLQVGTTGKQAVFQKDGFIFSAKLMEGDPIDADYLMRQIQSRFSVLTDADVLRHALSSVTSVSGHQTRLSFNFLGSRLQMNSDSENGKSSITIDVVPLSGGPQGEFWYDPEKLVECIRAQTGTLILEIAQNGILIMKTDKLVCVLNGMRKTRPAEIKEQRMKTARRPAKRTAQKQTDTADSAA